MNSWNRRSATELAVLSGLSLATLSKLRAIHDHRERFEGRAKDLPAAWTVLYDLTRLTDAQFKRLADDNKIRPDLTNQTIKFYTGLFARPREAKKGLRLFATIKILGSMDAESVERLRVTVDASLKDALRGVPAQVEFPESKMQAKDRMRREMAIKLHALLIKRLSTYKAARADLSDRQYETLENAAWQHQHKYQKKTYPYPASDKKSIENRAHPYSIKGKLDTRAVFLSFLRTKKIITPYNPISDFSDLGEAKCIKFALEYCEASTPKARRSATKRLDNIIKAKSTNAKHAQKYLEMIQSLGA